jgi:hypothetical protein
MATEPTTDGIPVQHKSLTVDEAMVHLYDTTLHLRGLRPVDHPYSGTYAALEPGRYRVYVGTGVFFDSDLSKQVMLWSGPIEIRVE